MTDANVEASADKFDTANAAQGQQVGGSRPTQGPMAVLGLEAGEEAELAETCYTFLLEGGAVMQFRLFAPVEEFLSHLADGGVAKVMTNGNRFDHTTGRTAPAWVPFYINLDKVVGFSPILTTFVSAPPPPAPAPGGDVTDNIDVV